MDHLILLSLWHLHRHSRVRLLHTEPVARRVALRVAMLIGLLLLADMQAVRGTSPRAVLGHVLNRLHVVHLLRAVDAGEARAAEARPVVAKPVVAAVARANA